MLEIIATYFLIFALTALTTLYAYYKYCYTYWSSQGVPTIPPTIPKGNMKGYLVRGLSVGKLTQGFYNDFKSKGLRYGGFYLGTRPVFLPVDLDLVKAVLTKDFDHFGGRGIYHSEGRCLSGNLFNYEGLKWRNLRVKFTPVFTSGKLKSVFGVLEECGKVFGDAIGEKKRKVPIEDVADCYSIDVIGSVVFGLDCNSFKTDDAEFRKFGMGIINPNISRKLRLFGSVVIPKIYKAFDIPLFTKSQYNFFYNAMASTIEERKKHGIVRKDFLQLLMDLKNSDKSLSMRDIAAQSFLFFIAGFGTSSATISFALYLLAKHQDIQSRIRQELKSLPNFTYDSIMGLKYLDQIVNETLRLYPTLPSIDRVCTKDYQIPDSDVILEKGTKVMISVYGMQHDPDFFPDPETFDPERFSDENKSRIPSHAYLPFGEGPRNCIGMRFGMMQVKAGLAMIIKRFSVSVNPEMKPIRFDDQNFALNPIDPILLDFEEVC